jgi:hypothetical protein
VGSLVLFGEEETGEWIRVSADKSTTATVQFCYNDDEKRATISNSIFAGLASAGQSKVLGGLLYGLGNNRRTLGLAGLFFDGENKKDMGYYELDENLDLKQVDDPETQNFILEKFAIPEEVLSIEASSVLVVDDQARRWRLPLGMDEYSELTQASRLRLSREVATERDLFSCHGTFYELPAENADGFAKIRPIASHAFRIHDFTSYRGMLVMTGINPETSRDNPHVIVSDNGKAAVWVGVIDDLWKLGKPTGSGGPWLNAEVDENEASDPYLIGFYDDRRLELSHQSETAVVFDIEVEPVGHGPWMKYLTVRVNPGETYQYRFPDHFQSRWIRFRSGSSTRATAWLEYK